MWKKKYLEKPIGFLFYLFMILIMLSLHRYTAFAGEIDAGDLDKEAKTVEYIDKVFGKMNTPGMSVIIVQKDKTRIINKGVEAVEGSVKVSEDTLFEMASNSKAFTALGILYLEQKQLLSLDDPVTKYIPYLYIPDYSEPGQNGAAKIKVRHLLDQTSGIPFLAMTQITPGEDKTALKETAVLLKRFQLENTPGEKYLYSSVNYDLLGLIIENISGQSFELFMMQNILEPLGLTSTCILKEEQKKSGKVAYGHKVSYLRAARYDAPLYRGNAPAAYFVTSATDMAEWLKLQMGFTDLPDYYEDLIDKSHKPNTGIRINQNEYYGFGWEVDAEKEYIQHSGLNPNFSTAIIISQKSGTAVGILSNGNSTNTLYIARNIINLYGNQPIEDLPIDMMIAIDRICCIGITVLSLLIILFLLLFNRKILRIKRHRQQPKNRGLIGVLISILSGGFLVFLIYQLYTLPTQITSGLTWEVIEVWGPASMIDTILLLGLFLIVVWSYIMLAFYFGRIKKAGKIPEDEAEFV